MSEAIVPYSPPRLPVRPTHLHKGTAGTVLILGGSASGDVRMIGAPALSAHGALRSGCGLVRVMVPRPIADTVLTLTPSATATTLEVDEVGAIRPSAAAEVLDQLLISASSLVIGPGMSDDASTQALALRAVQQEQAPVIVDAGALSALARVPALLKDFRARAILTPHPGEFRRLAEPLRIAADPVNPATRRQTAEQLAQRLGCIVILKGAGTVVSNGLETWVCDRGHPCMATAGTGDVLAGIIAGLIAQHGPEPINPLLDMARARSGAPAKPAGPSLFDLACISVLAHAAAGEEWARLRGASGGMLAMELAELLPARIEACRG